MAACVSNRERLTLRQQLKELLLLVANEPEHPRLRQSTLGRWLLPPGCDRHTTIQQLLREFVTGGAGSQLQRPLDPSQVQQLLSSSAPLPLSPRRLHRDDQPLPAQTSSQLTPRRPANENKPDVSFHIDTVSFLEHERQLQQEVVLMQRQRPSPLPPSQPTIRYEPVLLRPARPPSPSAQQQQPVLLNYFPPSPAATSDRPPSASDRSDQPTDKQAEHLPSDYEEPVAATDQVAATADAATQDDAVRLTCSTEVQTTVELREDMACQTELAIHDSQAVQTDPPVERLRLGGSDVEQVDGQSPPPSTDRTSCWEGGRSGGRAGDSHRRTPRVHQLQHVAFDTLSLSSSTHSLSDISEMPSLSARSVNSTLTSML